MFKPQVITGAVSKVGGTLVAVTSGNVVSVNMFVAGTSATVSADGKLVEGLPRPKTTNTTDPLDFCMLNWNSNAGINGYINYDGSIRTRGGVASGTWLYFSVTYITID